jgi:hypothetical protein
VISSSSESSAIKIARPVSILSGVKKSITSKKSKKKIQKKKSIKENERIGTNRAEH